MEHTCQQRLVLQVCEWRTAQQEVASEGVVCNMYHLAGGLALLHSKDWVHNDLHRGNVLQGQHWMLTDFGNSTPMCKPNGEDNELDRMM